MYVTVVILIFLIVYMMTISGIHIQIKELRAEQQAARTLLKDRYAEVECLRIGAEFMEKCFAHKTT